MSSTGAFTPGPNTSGTLAVTGTHGAETITASFDLIVGSNGSVDKINFALASDNGNANIASGLGKDDIITGSGDIDYLLGGDENDTITGKSGADWLAGGNGDDKFRYEVLNDSTHSAFDTILDFGNGIDKLQFDSALNLSIGTALGATTNNVGAGKVSWFVQDSTHTTVYANTGASPEAASSGPHVMEIHVVGTFVPTSDIGFSFT